MEFPIPRTAPYLPPQYRARGEEGPRRVTLLYGGEAWLVTGHADARTVLADTSFSSDSTLPGYPNFPLAPKTRLPGHFLSMDPPEHTQLRRLVAEYFRNGRVQALRPRLEQTASGLVEEFAREASPADLVAGVAAPLPAMAVAEMVGIPPERRELFLDCARVLQKHDATAVERLTAAGRMNRCLADIIEAKRGGADDDMLGHLARQRGGGFSTQEIIGATNLIVVAGLETTTGLISLTMLSLLRDPAQGDLVRGDPERWCRAATAEALRYWTLIQHGVARVATRDVRIADRTVRAGEAVVVHLPSANRDGSVYPRPDEFDLTREVRGQLAFGYGIHRCLGSSLAETQSTLIISELMRRLPGLRLAVEEEQLPFHTDMLVYGLGSLPVSW
ncbi:cytochrome P450 [Streptomyces sp. NPDC026589]|uniref:cytochrome P450 n=1 Tax=Streptomyces sp. NPDC026589 TaxID=3155609 RepID=UPI0033E8B315